MTLYYEKEDMINNMELEDGLFYHVFRTDGKLDGRPMYYFTRSKCDAAKFFANIMDYLPDTTDYSINEYCFTIQKKMP